MMTRVSRRAFVALASLSVVGLAACGGGDAAPAASSTAAPVGPAPGSGGEVTLEVSSAGEDSKFDKEALEAPAGSKITLVFKNAASADSAKLFNWVLTKPGTHLRVVNAGATEGEASGYVKPNDENVIAATKMIKAGESDTITFDAPPPGEYVYVSTFPGYYTRMRGVLTIK